MKFKKLILLWVFFFFGPIWAKEKDSPCYFLFHPRSPYTFTFSSGGKEVALQGQNYLLKPAHGQPLAARPGVEDIAGVLFNRSPLEQKHFDRLLRDYHEDFENSFNRKDEKTGSNVVFTPEVNGMVVPISTQFYNQSTQTSQIVLRTLRAILQNFYAYGTVAGNQQGKVGEITLDPLTIKTLNSIMHSSVYFEPSLSHRNLEDYPFLPVSGFDLAVSDPQSADGLFFEFNLGTPSGLSNNIQLLEGLRIHDPKLFHSFKDRLPPNNAFSLLRKTIEGNAQNWSHAEGLSVIVGPGPYNGAHPDVAYISNFSGMPLVRMADLYIDKLGFVRLNQGRGDADQRVTGIYTRVDESFVLNSIEKNIPLRSPYFATINRELNQKFGTHLDLGIGYDYIYDANGKVIDFQKDPTGKPLLQKSWDAIGLDPSRNVRNPKDSLLDAVHNRKVYISGLGGRVADDKRVFEALAHSIKPHLPSHLKYAHPPDNLSASELKEFFEGMNLQRFVVKEPDKSGADGVHIMAHLEPERQLKVVTEVRKNPTRFVVQRFVESSLLVSSSSDINGNQFFDTRIADWRIFIFLDENGNAQSDPQSLLLRIAKQNSTISNTSAGGGYGIGIVLDEQPRKHGIELKTLIPQPKQNDAVGIIRQTQLTHFFVKLRELKKLLKQNVPISEVFFDEFILAHREVMDLVGREYSPLMSLTRRFQKSQISLINYENNLNHYIDKMMRGSGFTDVGVAPIARSVLERP